MTKNNKYIFWSNDLSILYTNKKYLEFIPTSDMTKIEQLNAITRFCIYFLILAFVTVQTENANIWIQIPILTIVFTYILFIIYDSDNLGKLNEHYVTTQETDTEKIPKIIIEAGQYDEQNELVTDIYQPAKLKNKKKRTHSFDKNLEYLKNTCLQPTPANPFMNPTVNDFGVEMPPIACNVDDELIQDKMTDAFNKDLFTDVSDLFERQNSQRQFYSIPSSLPPDTVEFANWLYSPESTCKINQSKCGSFEDLRYNR